MGSGVKGSRKRGVKERHGEKRGRRKKREERYHGNQRTSTHTLPSGDMVTQEPHLCPIQVVGQAAVTSFPQCAAQMECFDFWLVPHPLALLVTAHSFANFSF